MLTHGCFSYPDSYSISDISLRDSDRIIVNIAWQDERVLTNVEIENLGQLPLDEEMVLAILEKRINQAMLVPENTTWLWLQEPNVEVVGDSIVATTIFIVNDPHPPFFQQRGVKVVSGRTRTLLFDISTPSGRPFSTIEPEVKLFMESANIDQGK
jgi:hypothetical protein